MDQVVRWPLARALNLSDLGDVAEARTNLGVGAWLVDTGAPAGGLGQDGDWYIDDANGNLYSKSAGSWTLLGNIASTVDHGGLSGLGDDDHTQYHNDTRGDARYLQLVNNLSDLANTATARSNLGLGALAVLSLVTNALLSTAAGEIGAAWAAWTPALTASTTNPTLGTGKTQTGYYLKIGKLVIAYGTLGFGTSGTAAGTGTYYISLPTGSARTTMAGFPCGLASLNNSGTGYNRIVVTHSGSAKVQMEDLSAAAVTHAAPFSWGVSDFMRLFFIYELA